MSDDTVHKVIETFGPSSRGCAMKKNGYHGGVTMQLAAESNIRWAAGAMDGVLAHHMGGGPDEDNVKSLLDLVQNYWTTPTAKNKADVYDFLVEKGIVSVIDPFIEQLTQREDVNHDRLYDLARSFAIEAPDREPVKCAIAVLGLYSQSEDLDIFRTLGRHDEFTLFCAVAVSKVAEDGERELWELAKNVDGWGRIQIVERLADTENFEIKEWMLRDGYKNSVMYEYLAYICGTTGGLLGALSQDDVDDELLTSTAELIQALINGGPEDYALPLNGDHGVAHWARVLENGRRLAEETGANVEVVSLFAVFHDSRRVNEVTDPDHGQRAAEFATELRGDFFELGNHEFRLLYRACEGHTHERNHPDITIQTCWDSDRLDLGRVGIMPHPSRLCTDVAKRPETIKWADGRACFRVVPEFVADEWGIEL